MSLFSHKWKETFDTFQLFYLYSLKITAYKKIANVDLAGIHDYRCRFSLSVMECTISVFDQREAEDVCDIDDECRGFVMSQNKTWTG